MTTTTSSSTRPDRSRRPPSGSRRSSRTSTAATRGAGSGSRVAALDLGLDEGNAPPAASDGTRFVEVAIDAAGAGGMRTYTYAVPDTLADLKAGEAVIVEFGRRQALAVVLGEAVAPEGVETKPVADRVRADGPLLPPLSLALARWIAGHYLVAPSLVLRAMLPPGMLERLELVVERTPASGRAMAGRPDADADAVTQDLLDQLAAGPRPARELAAPEGRAGLLRRLRGLEADGLVTVDWTLTAAGAGPRFERWIVPTDAGRSAAADPAAVGGRPLGPRQRDALAELAAGPRNGLLGADLSGRHGSGAIAGLVRRELAATEIRERPRRPLAARPAGRRGGRPPDADLSPEQATAVALVRDAIRARDATPLLLEGVTGGGKTA